MRLAPCDCCSGLRWLWAGPCGPPWWPGVAPCGPPNLAPLPHHEPPAAPPPQPLIRQVTGRPTPTIQPSSRIPNILQYPPKLQQPPTIWNRAVFYQRHPGTAPRARTIFNLQQQSTSCWLDLTFNLPFNSNLQSLNIQNLTFESQKMC